MARIESCIESLDEKFGLRAWFMEPEIGILDQCQRYLIWEGPGDDSKSSEKGDYVSPEVMSFLKQYFFKVQLEISTTSGILILGTENDKKNIRT